MSVAIILRARQNKLLRMSNRKWNSQLNSTPSLKRRNKGKITSLWSLIVKSGPLRILSI
jgi:hypothetical protein